MLGKDKPNKRETNKQNKRFKELFKKNEDGVGVLTQVFSRLLAGVVSVGVFLVIISVFYGFITQLSVYLVQGVLTAENEQEVLQYMAYSGVQTSLVTPILTGFVFYYLTKIRVYGYVRDKIIGFNSDKKTKNKVNE